MVVTDAAVNVLIVSAHPISLSGLKIFVESTFPGCAVKTSSMIDSVKSEIKGCEGNPIVLICDAPSFDKKVSDLILELDVNKSLVHLILILENPGLYEAGRLIECGVSGILNKQEPLEYLQSCIITVLNRGIYLSVNLVNSLVKSGSGSAVGSINMHLSKRQHEIYNLLSQGYRTNDICRELNLKPSTVSTQKKIILGKLGIMNHTEIRSYLKSAI